MPDERLKEIAEYIFSLPYEERHAENIVPFIIETFHDYEENVWTEIANLIGGH